VNGRRVWARRAAAAPRTGAAAAPPAGLPFALLVALALPVSFALAPRPARANAEEFSSFDVELQEQDDETVIDHLLTRAPREWRAEWERAPQAFRTSQGCLTSGQWIMLNDLKLRTALGRHSTFNLNLLQSHDDTESFDYLGLGFQRAVPNGSLGLIFAPSYDKSKQDFALRWEFGADTSSFQLMSQFTLEDTFNNIWEFRQSRAGQASEPYLRHPYESELRVVSRGERLRLEAGGRWLSPGVKRIEGLYGGPPYRIRKLWGALGYAAMELHAIGCEWEARGVNEQADGADHPDSLGAPDGADFRRQWSGEISVRRALDPRTSVVAHLVYQERTQRYGEGLGPGLFAAVDRVYHVEVNRRLTENLRLRVGGLYDRLGFARTGVTRFTSEDRKKESRAFIGLMARFGRVSVQGVEGIELDREPYDVTLHHDKGFLQLQTTF
jgi:hypothetical protein